MPSASARRLASAEAFSARSRPASRRCSRLVLLLIVLGALVLLLTEISSLRNVGRPRLSAALRPASSGRSGGHAGARARGVELTDAQSLLALASEAAGRAAAAHGADVAGRTVVLTHATAQDAHLLSNYLEHAKATGVFPAAVIVAFDQVTVNVAASAGALVHLTTARPLGAAAWRAFPPVAGRVEPGLVEPGLVEPHVRSGTPAGLSVAYGHAAVLLEAGYAVWLADVRIVWNDHPFLFPRSLVGTGAPVVGSHTALTRSGHPAEAGCNAWFLSDAPYGAAAEGGDAEEGFGGVGRDRARAEPTAGAQEEREELNARPWVGEADGGGPRRSTGGADSRGGEGNSDGSALPRVAASVPPVSSLLSLFHPSPATIRWLAATAAALAAPPEGPQARPGTASAGTPRPGGQEGATGLRPSERVRRELVSALARCGRAHVAVQAVPRCLRWCLLPVSLFPNWLHYSQQRRARRPLAVAANWMAPSTVELRLRQEGLWADADADPDGVDAAMGQPAGLASVPATGEPQPTTVAGSQSARYLAFHEGVLSNGFSNSFNALRSALAIATLTNRTLILPRLASRHLHGEPYAVDAGYYFDLRKLRAHFRVSEAPTLGRLFGAGAARWPPDARWRVHMLQISPAEVPCAELERPELLEARGATNETCPPLPLGPGQLRAHLASGRHLGATEMELRRWLEPEAESPLLLFGRMFRRFGRFDSPWAHAAFERRIALGLRPSPEVRIAASSALRILQDAVAAGAGGGSNFSESGAGSMRPPTERWVAPDFDCVHMRRRDFIVDHAADELSVGEYARLAVARLAEMDRVGRGGGSAEGTRSVDTADGRRRVAAASGGAGKRPGDGESAGAARAGGRRLAQRKWRGAGEPASASGDGKPVMAPRALYLASDVAEEPDVREAFAAAGAPLVFSLSQVFPKADLDVFGTYEHSRLLATAASEAHRSTSVNRVSAAGRVSSANGAAWQPATASGEPGSRRAADGGHERSDAGGGRKVTGGGGLSGAHSGGDDAPGAAEGNSTRHAAARALARDMRFGAIDQLVCSRARFFVGNLWSSFTHHICYLRELEAMAKGRSKQEACDGADVYGRHIDPRMTFV